MDSAPVANLALEQSRRLTRAGQCHHSVEHPQPAIADAATLVAGPDPGTSTSQRDLADANTASLARGPAIVTTATTATVTAIVDLSQWKYFESPGLLAGAKQRQRWIRG